MKYHQNEILNITSQKLSIICKVSVSGEQTKNRIYCVQHQEKVNKKISECRQ